jgi:preprotein translocase subunit YajC
MHPLLNAFLSQTAPTDAGPFGSMLLPAVMVLVVFYVIMWRPQAKERKKLEAFRQSIKKGDVIWTQAGIIGTVAQVEDQAVMVDVGGGTKLRVLKTFIGGEWKEKAAGGEPAKAEARK